VVSDEGADECEDVSETCGGLEKNKCETPNAVIATDGKVLNCFWLLESEPSASKCEKIEDTCENVLSQPLCLTPEASKRGPCIWLASEGIETRCVELKSSCDEVTRGRERCETPEAVGGKSCIWVEGEADGENCQEIK
jgi:hypothetical protein